MDQSVSSWSKGTPRHTPTNRVPAPEVGIDGGQSLGMGLFFFPRGGSARVATYLSRALDEYGWPVTLACGSIGEPGSIGNADTVFCGCGYRARPLRRCDRAVEARRGSDGRAVSDAPVVRVAAGRARPGLSVCLPGTGRADGRGVGRASGVIRSTVPGAAASPASSDAAPRCGGHRAPGCPGADASARHRAEDARRDRPRASRESAARTPAGGHRGCAPGRCGRRPRSRSRPTTGPRPCGSWDSTPRPSSRFPTAWMSTTSRLRTRVSTSA